MVRAMIDYDAADAAIRTLPGVARYSQRWILGNWGGADALQYARVLHSQSNVSLMDNTGARRQVAEHLLATSGITSAAPPPLVLISESETGGRDERD